MVIVLIANLIVVIVNWNIEILQMFHERSIQELKAFWRKNFLLVIIWKFYLLHVRGVERLEDHPKQC